MMSSQVLNKEKAITDGYYSGWSGIGIDSFDTQSLRAVIRFFIFSSFHSVHNSYDPEDWQEDASAQKLRCERKLITIIMMMKSSCVSFKVMKYGESYLKQV